jgi:septal ring factor EnvC (AmiA/AmiB activator)
MDHLLRQLAETTRVMEIATQQIEALKHKVHDLEVENQRLRDQLAFRVTQYDEVVGMNQGLIVRINQLEVDNSNLKARIARNLEAIRRMEEGEL